MVTITAYYNHRYGDTVHADTNTFVYYYYHKNTRRNDEDRGR